MPWSPIPLFPKVFESLRNDNITHQVNRGKLRIEIIRTIGTTKESTITEYIKLMVDLGYIKDSGESSIFYIYQDKPYNFPQLEKEIDEELDKYMHSD